MKFVLKMSIALGCLIVLNTSIRMATAQTPDATPDAIPPECYTINPASRNAKAGDPAINIVTPDDDSIFYGTEMAISVITENFDESEGWHWHVWVDEKLQVMLHEQTAFLRLTPGTHRLCAFLSDMNHQDIGHPDALIVTIVEPGSGTPKSTLAIPNTDDTIVYTPNVLRRPEPEKDNTLTIVLIVGGGVIITLVSLFVGIRMSAVYQEDDDSEEEESAAQDG